MTNTKRHFAALVAVPILVLTGCSGGGIGASDSQGIVDACSTVYRLDWKNVNFDQIGEYANRFVSIKNSSVSLGSGARATVSGIADLVAEMDLHYDEGRNFINYELDFNSDTFLEDSEEFDKTWQAERERIAEAINSSCEPYF
jgi:hypothetical protein